MTARPKIAVVASDLMQPRFLGLFEPLLEAFDVCVYALNSEALINRHGTRLKLRLFENLPDMPGYLRGLEEELAQCDAIIGLETSRLGTFQAVRAARKFNKPLAVVVNEHLPFFYERYANIRAIQFDICNKADLFFVTSNLAAHALQLDRVPSESIKLVHPKVDSQRFKPCSAQRKKFRDYVGIGVGELVVLFHDELEVWNRPELPLEALNLLVRRGSIDPSRVRLIFAGSGSKAADLKYRCFDLNLGKMAMFLHQDPEPFLADLYAASDIIVSPRPQKADFHQELPLGLLEAMAAGAVPVVGTGSVAQELAGDAAQVVLDDTPEALAASLLQLLTSPSLLRGRSEASVALVRAQNGVEGNGRILVEAVWSLLESHRSLRRDEVDLAKETTSLRRRLEQGQVREALERIEELFLRDDLPPTQEKAELFCLRGEALQAVGDMEAAMNAYSDALKIDDRNYRCYRGLGFLSWQGHSNEEALMFFRKALALQSDDSETMMGIGLIYRRLGLTDDAIFWLEKCVLRDGHPASALVALTQSCMESTRVDAVIRVLERVMDAVGEVPAVLMTLGQLYMNSGRVAQGHALLQRALSDPKSA